ncbi:MAG: DMT family transporter [Clostridiales bacterium]|nr:DMT family transporter [Clostridiales bacterium]
MDQRKRAVAAGITGNVIFGFSFLASKIALNYAAPMELLSIRFGVSMLILLLLISLKIMRLDLKGKNILPLIALGLCQPVLYFCFENYGLMYSTSSFSGIMIGMAPVASTVTAAIFLKEKVSRRSMAGIAVCVVGVVITSLSEKSEGSVTAVGFLCLCGAIMMAMIYSLLNKRSSGEFSPFERTFVMFTVGFIAFFAVNLFQLRGDLPARYANLLTEGNFMMPVLYLAVISSLVAFFCINYSISYLPVQQAVSYTNLTPIISVIAGVVILSEPFSPGHLVGMVLVLVGICQVNV